MTGGNWQDKSASIGTSTAAWGMGNGPEVVVDWQGTSTFVETGWNPHQSPIVTDSLVGAPGDYWAPSNKTVAGNSSVGASDASGRLPNRLLLRVIRLVRLPVLRGICMETPWPVPVLELLLVVLKDGLTRMPGWLAPTLEVGQKVRPRRAIMATFVMLALLASVLVDGSKVVVLEVLDVVVAVVVVLAVMRLVVRGLLVLLFSSCAFGNTLPRAGCVHGNFLY
jgi:hypothetical protein